MHPAKTAVAAATMMSVELLNSGTEGVGAGVFELPVDVAVFWNDPIPRVSPPAVTSPLPEL